MYQIAAIQMHVLPGQVEANHAKAIQMAEQAVEKGANCIVFPELWSSGYHLSREQFAALAETPDGPTVTTFQALAKQWNTVLIVPFPEKETEQLYISLAVIEKTGELLYSYRKSFVWGREKAIFSPGQRAYKPVQTSLGKIGVLICYDIEFPEPSRLLAWQGAELLIVPSVWSFGAESRWDIQLPARALDNTVFVLGVNTVGEGSCGKSKLIAPNGAVLNEAPREAEFILLHRIDTTLISTTRQSIPYLVDYDESLLPGGMVGSI